MEMIIPKCVNNNICLNICNVKTCKAIPFLCADDQCSCHSLHHKCSTVLNWKDMRQCFSNKLKSSSEIAGYFTQIDDIYKNGIKQIEKSFEKIKIIFNNHGLSQLEQKVYQKLKQEKYTELTGELINKIEAKLMQDKKQFQFRIIEKEKKQIEKQIIILVQMMEELSKLNMKAQLFNASINDSQKSFKLDSKITQDVYTVSSFFPNKKIESMKLLYRASENNFQLTKFHDKCDGNKHTITIIKTQFGKVIGGYTPLLWDKAKHGNYQVDNSMQSFIFSLTNKNKLRLIKGRQQYAIYQYISYGPTFNNDLVISDKANQNTNSYALPGNTYNYNNEYNDNQQSFKKFSGQSFGQCFKIQEWQVHSILSLINDFLNILLDQYTLKYIDEQIMLHLSIFFTVNSHQSKTQ